MPAFDPSLFEFWFLFPLAVVVAVCALSSSIGGSNFWTPIYLLWLGLEPRVAFWVALLTMLCGFGSGVVRNLRDGTWDRYLVVRYLAVAGPATLVGALLSTRLPVSFLLAGFAIFVSSYGLYLLVEFLRGPAVPPPHDKVFWGVGLAAGFLQGTIASGAGILLMPALINHHRVRHHSGAVGSAVILVFTTSLISTAFRIDGALLGDLTAGMGEIFRIILFAGPGVIIGGQLGPLLARRLARRHLRLWVGVLLLVAGTMVGYRAFG